MGLEIRHRLRPVELVVAPQVSNSNANRDTRTQATLTTATQSRISTCSEDDDDQDDQDQDCCYCELTRKLASRAKSSCLSWWSLFFAALKLTIRTNNFRCSLRHHYKSWPSSGNSNYLLLASSSKSNYFARDKTTTTDVWLFWFFDCRFRTFAVKFDRNGIIKSNFPILLLLLLFRIFAIEYSEIIIIFLRVCKLATRICMLFVCSLINQQPQE